MRPRAVNSEVGKDFFVLRGKLQAGEKALEWGTPARSFPVIEVRGGHLAKLETRAASHGSGLYSGRCDGISASRV